jgi:anti-sigma regulatory factor (Ser/Thr protein kinase)
MGLHALGELIPAWRRQTHLELAAFSSAVPCARAHVRAVATECGLGHLADTAELLASEIVTNAVQASGQLKIAGTPIVRITVTTERESLLICVWDGSDEMPIHQQAVPNDDSGRGLTIIETLSTDWGACPETDGKVVWALIGPIPSGGFGCNSRAPASSSSSS